MSSNDDDTGIPLVCLPVVDLVAYLLDTYFDEISETTRRDYLLKFLESAANAILGPISADFTGDEEQEITELLERDATYDEVNRFWGRAISAHASTFESAVRDYEQRFAQSAGRKIGVGFLSALEKRAEAQWMVRMAYLRGLLGLDPVDEDPEPSSAPEHAAPNAALAGAAARSLAHLEPVLTRTIDRVFTECRQRVPVDPGRLRALRARAEWAVFSVLLEEMEARDSVRFAEVDARGDEKKWQAYWESVPVFKAAVERGLAKFVTDLRSALA